MPAEKPPTSNDPTRPSPSALQDDLDECMRWWGDLLEMSENGGKNPFMFCNDDVVRLPEPGIGDLGGADEDGLTFDAEILFGG